MFQRRPGFNHFEGAKTNRKPVLRRDTSPRRVISCAVAVYLPAKSRLCVAYACMMLLVCRTVCIEWSGTKTHSKRRSATAKARYYGYTYTI